MDYAQIIREEIAKAKAEIRQEVANLLQQTQLTNPTASGEEDGAAGWPQDGDSGQRAPRRWQHCGFRSVPPNNTPVIMALVGGGSAAEVTLAEDGTGYGPDPGPGGAALYSTKTGAYVVIDADGKVTVSAAAGQQVVVNAGAAADVVVNAGTAKVALHGDATAGHTHTVTATVAAANGVVPAAVTTSSAIDHIDIPGTRRFKGA